MEGIWEYILCKYVRVIVRSQKVKKSLAHPIGVSFAVMGFVTMQGIFKEVIRIDNSLHQGKSGTHVHYFDRREEKVESTDIKSPEDALDYVERYLRQHYAAWVNSNERN